MAQSVVKKISLPLDLSLSRRNPFEVADEFGKSSVRRNADEPVQMVRQQNQLKIPLLRGLILTRRFEKQLSDL
jgi:hypothetical protein